MPRSVFLVTILMFASAAARADAPAPPPVPAFLKAETRLGKTYKQRAIAGKVKPALSYAPGGAKVAEAYAFDELIVVEEEGDKVRVAADGPIVRVAYYVDPAALPIVARKG